MKQLTYVIWWDDGNGDGVCVSSEVMNTEPTHLDLFEFLSEIVELDAEMTGCSPENSSALHGKVQTYKYTEEPFTYVNTAEGELDTSYPAEYVWNQFKSA